MRPLFVGEDYGSAPEAFAKPRYCLTGQSGRTLARLAGVGLLVFCIRVERVNVVDRPAQWRDKGLVAIRVAEIRRAMRGRRVVLLGTRVAEAFGYEQGTLPWWEWRATDHGGSVAMAPHPSGRNRLLNQQSVRERYAAFMREMAATW
jgi:hypothetical protein